MDSVLEKLKRAEKASIRASELTKQLLTFSRGGKPVKKTCDLRETLKEAASFAATGSPFAVSFQLAEDLKPAWADLSQIGSGHRESGTELHSGIPGWRGYHHLRGKHQAARGNRYSLEPGEYILFR